MNRRLAAALSAAFLAFTSSGTGKLPASEYQTRRDNLRKGLDGVLVLFGQTEGRDDVFRFVQESNFYYLTGWMEPGARLLITPTEETIFLPHHDERREHYTGRRLSAEDADVKAATGFERVMPIEKFESELDAALAAHEKLYALSGPFFDKLRARYPLRDVADGAPMVAKLRMKKSAAEIEAIQHATDVSIQAQRAGWKRIRAGSYEYQIAAVIESTFTEKGCEGPAYSPIVGSGPNSTVLHSMENQRRMDRGEVIVIDAAAECANYASDITRTLPIGGKFTTREREIYQVVLGAQKAAVAALKPGARLSGAGETLTKLAKDYMDAHGKDLHGEGLGKYFVHGIGHQVGIDVHDATVDEPLDAGMVVTLEPGIYIPEEKIGVRIEDVYVVTEKGAKDLSAALPKEPDDIEKALAE